MIDKKLADSQLKVLSEIGVVLGQLAAGSMVLPFIFPGLDEARVPIVVLGLLITFSSWTFSIIVVRRVKNGR